jgi:hypothetical protein
MEVAANCLTAAGRPSARSLSCSTTSDIMVRAIFEEELGLPYKSPSDDDDVPAVEAPRGGVAEGGRFEETKP